MREELIWGLVVTEMIISYPVWWPIRWAAYWGLGCAELGKMKSSISDSPHKVQTDTGASTGFYKSLLHTVKARWAVCFHSIYVCLYWYTVYSNDCVFHWFSSVSQSCPTLCDPMDCSMPGCPSPIPELAQTHVHWVSDAIQPSHPLSSPSPLPFNLSQHQSFLMSWLFASGGQSIGASVSVLAMNIQDWYPLGLTGLISLQSKGLSRVFSNVMVQKYQFVGAQLSL